MFHAMVGIELPGKVVCHVVGIRQSGAGICGVFVFLTSEIVMVAQFRGADKSLYRIVVSVDAGINTSAVSPRMRLRRW